MCREHEAICPGSGGSLRSRLSRRSIFPRSSGTRRRRGCGQEPSGQQRYVAAVAFKDNFSHCSKFLRTLSTILAKMDTWKGRLAALVALVSCYCPVIADPIGEAGALIHQWHSRQRHGTTGACPNADYARQCGPAWDYRDFEKDQSKRTQFVVDQFRFAWEGYEKYAFPVSVIPLSSTQNNADRFASERRFVAQDQQFQQFAKWLGLDCH